MNFKKLSILILSIALTISSSLTVFAETQRTSGVSPTDGKTTAYYTATATSEEINLFTTTAPGTPMSYHTYNFSVFCKVLNTETGQYSERMLSYNEGMVGHAPSFGIILTPSDFTLEGFEVIEFVRYIPLITFTTKFMNGCTASAFIYGLDIN